MNERQYPAAAPAHVYLFATCLVDLFVPEAGLDAVRLLEREGLTVHYPRGQSCCGQPAYSSGNPDEARRVAAAQLDLFAEPWPVIVPSGSCGGMIRHHWPALFADDPVHGPKARAIAERTYELAEFLVHVLDVRLDALAAPAGDDERVVLHTSCAARREMGTRVHGVALVDAVGERRAQNVPGTDLEYPNWQIPLAGADGRVVLLDDLASDPRFRALAAAVDARV